MIQLIKYLLTNQFKKPSSSDANSLSVLSSKNVNNYSSQKLLSTRTNTESNLLISICSSLLIIENNCCYHTKCKRIC